MHDPSADGELIDGLRQRILESVGLTLRGAERCALVGFPNHNNSGDNAIWLGELRMLEQLGVEIAYRCDDVSYHPGDLANALPAGPILLHGGGNYGDLWPAQQAFRERVMRDFPDRPLVQLPQTITFMDPRSVAAHRMLLHDRTVTMAILCRDETSARFVAEQLGLEPILCPDPAFLLDSLPVAEPEVDVVLNERADHEASDGPSPEFDGLSVEHHDWFPPPGSVHLRRAASVRCRTATRSIAAMANGGGLPARLFRRLPLVGATRFAERRVARACGLLSRGQVVVTDRLHGHILCMLMGIPHVIRDTAHGKVGDFHESFTRDSVTTFVAGGPDEVGRLVRSLLVGVRDERWS